MNQKPPGTALALVPEIEPPYARAQRLQAEALQAIAEHVEAMLEALTRAAEGCAEVAGGSDLYPASVRDRAKKLAEFVAAERDGIDIAFRTAIAANERRRP